MDAYKRLAEHLDSLPQGFPPTADGSELRILQKLFTPEEADVAARLTSERETVEEIAARTGLDAAKIRDPLKSMARRGLIEAGVKGKALAFESMPFVVGFYETAGPPHGCGVGAPGGELLPGRVWQGAHHAAAVPPGDPGA